MFDAKIEIDDQARSKPVDGGLRRLGFAWRLGLLCLTAAAIGAAIYAFGGDLLFWASDTIRSAQAELARAVRAVRAGEPLAMVSLLGACFLYGFAHAVGPGHGKLLIAGAATASRKAAWRMAGVGFVASLTQAATAILLAYGALGLFSLTGRAAVGLAENWLAPLSAAAVTLVGFWLVWRGVRGLVAARRANAAESHSCGHGCEAGCRHMPSAEEAERADSWLETVALILSIGIRPCSGALIVLAIAWNFGLYTAGAASAFAMAVGTGIVVSGVALFATSFRDAQALRGSDGASRRLHAWVQIGAGSAVALLSGLVVAAVLVA